MIAGTLITLCLRFQDSKNRQVALYSAWGSEIRLTFWVNLFQDDTATNNVYHFGTLFESSYIANKLKNKQW